jgi:hypothetical protein
MKNLLWTVPFSHDGEKIIRVGKTNITGSVSIRSADLEFEGKN